MVRIARERIDDLFAHAEREAAEGHRELPDRYVVLARRIGTRHNVRLLPEYRELYCRGCSSYWVEGRTVRTRLRSGRRVRTCLVCGRERRMPIRPPKVRPRPVAPSDARRPLSAVIATEVEDSDEVGGADDEREDG
jgi:ribonuclease P protein subunit RPR2